MKFILGKKVKMGQIFDEEGNEIPVTVVEAGPCEITHVKTEDKNGYSAVQVGFEKKRADKVKKTERDKPYKYLKEFRVEPEQAQEYEVGEQIKVDEFEPQQKVKVSGTSKGKGFQGAMQRWNFSGLPASHGTKDKARSPGSIGSAYPQRVRKGKKMAGHGGQERTTVDNLEVIKIDQEKNLMAIKGALPGSRGNLVEIVSKE